MSTARRNGIEIDYEVRGAGPPLLLLEGLGYGRWMWRGQIPALEKEFTLLLVDNRGVGRSTPLSGPYSVPEFARDALAVLDEERIDRTAILGTSMGGFIAQSLAAIAPDRASALVLACTMAGGPLSRPMPPETWSELTRAVPGETGTERLRRTMGLALTPRYPQERTEEWEAILRERLASPTDPTQWMYQAMSVREFDARASDARLDIPVLVTTGTEDRVVPWTNSLELFRILPRATLLLFHGQNHLHFLERADEFNSATRRFLTTAPEEAVVGRVDEVG